MKRFVIFPILLIISVMTVWAQNPTVFLDKVDDISHDTVNAYGSVYFAGLAASDTGYVYTEVSSSGIFYSASDILKRVGPGPHQIISTADTLSDDTEYELRLRAGVKDTSGSLILNSNPQVLVFRTLKGPQLGVVNSISLVNQGVTSLDLNLNYICGNILTSYIVDWGYSSGNYSVGSDTLMLLGSGDTVLTVAGLQSSSNVFFRARTLNALGYGPVSTAMFTTANTQGFILYATVYPTWYEPDSAGVNITYSTGTFGSSLLSGVLKDNSGGVVNTLSAAAVNGVGSIQHTIVGMQPSHQYKWISVLTDSTGSMVKRDTLVFTSEPISEESGTISVTLTDRSSLNWSGTYNTNGMFSASETMYVTEVENTTTGQIVSTDTIGEFLGEGNFSGSICDLEGGGAYVVRLFGVRGQWSKFLDSDVGATMAPQTPQIATSLSIINENYVKVVFTYDGRGNFTDLETTVYVNQEQISMDWDTTLGSCSRVVEHVYGPFSSGDQVFIDAAVSFGSNGDQETAGKSITIPGSTAIEEFHLKGFTGQLKLYNLVGQHVGFVSVINGRLQRSGKEPGIYVYHAYDTDGNFAGTGKKYISY